MISLPPGIIILVGALALPLLPRSAQAIGALALPALSLAQLLFLSQGVFPGIELAGLSLLQVRVDPLSLAFGYIFHIAAFIAALYALHVRDTIQHVTAMLYVGSAIGAVFAGDLITLFIYWEITALASVFLIFASRTQRAYQAGIRYLIVQIGSGVLLLAGILLHYHDSGSLSFDQLIGPDGNLSDASAGVWLIFAAFGIKCAFPLLHNWLQDAYPQATVTGAVFLSAFTTKLAVYALARGFPGTEVLIGIGVVMTLFPIFFAVIENDLRKVLCYSLNNQLGFMVVGVGIGTELALNGAVAHAFVHILYKALLFMSMGAVLYRTGTIRASDLGGLYRSMPWTSAFCIVGAMSISAFPLFSGFVAKSLTMSAVTEGYYMLTFIGLLIASAGVMEHSGIKIPYFAFFGHDSGIRCKEAPWHMCLAMGVAAILCIAIGWFPQPLYALLPYPVVYQPYADFGHSVTQLQLLLFAALAFVVLKRTGMYPAEQASLNLDTDWLYRRVAPRVIRQIVAASRQVGRAFLQTGSELGRTLMRLVLNHYGPEGTLARAWPTGSMVLWVAVLLGASLILFYL
ncbi:MAG: Na(+)/H(+) antiporter subunit D [Proteobacteria bacterium TMED51]|jgi:multicomponent Na+:H+ antiporter subunit D|nr:MAG: Na(+)/H(+) antiporter subunit D [Proteobacteria bacterium TMED51]|tara:strand:+ start:2224 stop:3936 length:1713 start_codon:yes stop_codon:yes gene_type:complete